MVINESDCTLTYYGYYLTDKTNFIPIFVIDVPYSTTQIAGEYTTFKYDVGNFFGIKDLGSLPIWGEILTHVDPSTHKATSSQHYPYLTYEDDIVKITTTVNLTRQEQTCDAKFVDSNKFRQANVISAIIYNNPQNGYFSAYTIALTFVHFSDDVYDVANAPQGIIFIKDGYNDVLSNILPTAGKKGSCSAINASGYNPIISYDGHKTNDPYCRKILGKSKKIDTKDPNPGGGDSKPGGGGGSGDIGGDTNPDDGLPTISALDSGLLTAYNPTVTELQSLGRFLWSDSFDITTFKKLFNDPFDTLLGLSVVPVKPNTSGTKSIMFGNMDSGVSASVVSNQWVPKDMGSITLNEVWHGALDYAPSTGVSIYLPFIGMRQLNVNDIMGSTIHLIYKFDVLTGSCIAQLYVNHDSQGNKSGGFSWNQNQGLLYEFIGQCSENIPLASQDFTNTIRAAIGGVSVAAGAAASIATGNPAIGIAALTVGAANAGMQASTPTVERGGHLSGSASIMGYSQPFLIVERPHQCKPSRYYALRGVPSQVYTSKLSDCTGFTQITSNNNLHIAGASDSELAELQNLLVSGVYFPDKKR